MSPASVLYLLESARCVYSATTAVVLEFVCVACLFACILLFGVKGRAAYCVADHPCIICCRFCLLACV